MEHSSSSNLIWTNKYKPEQIEHIILDEDIKKKFRQIVITKKIPDLIITGSNGIGKSLTLNCLVREIYAKKIDEYVVILNATMNRNTKTLQEKLENFCRKAVSDNNLKRFIIVDEIDNIAQKTQRVISTIMEKYQHNTSFAFTCNTSFNIIESIQSKCIIIRYMKPPKENIIDLLKRICLYENIEFTNKGLDQIYHISQGDLRLAINNMQTVHDVFESITVDNVYKICDIPNPSSIMKIINYCVLKDIKNAIISILALKDKGYTGSDILTCMLNLLKDYQIDDQEQYKMCNLSEELKIKAINFIGMSMYNMSKGIDSDIQLSTCVIQICHCV